MFGMGLIRKTLSVGTLGRVAFHSKNERLRRAERSQSRAEAELGAEHTARKGAEARITAAEQRLKHASAKAETAARRLEESKRRNRRHAKGETMGDVFAGLEPLVRSGVEGGQKVGRRARKAARRSLQRAKDAATS